MGLVQSLDNLPDTTQADVNFLAEETKSSGTETAVGDESSESKQSFDDLVEKELEKTEKPAEKVEKVAESAEKVGEKPEEEPKVDENELTTPNFSRFKAENPEIIKKNPWIQRAVYAEREYTKLFPTVDDAKTASAYLGAMRQFETAILDGDSKVLLSSLDQQSKPAFKKFAKNFVQSLAQVNAEVAAEGVILPVVNATLRNAITVGEQSGNKNLALAAKHLSAWLNGTPDVPSQVEDKPDPQEMVNKREKEIFDQQANTWWTGVKDNTNQKLIDSISESVKGLDIPQLTKKAAVGEIFDKVIEALGNDPAHVALMRSHREKAFSEVRTGTHTQYESRIQSAFLERAKPLINVFKSKVLEEILPKATAPKTAAAIPANGSTVPAKRITRDKLRGMSEMDILKIGAED